MDSQKPNIASRLKLERELFELKLNKNECLIAFFSRFDQKVQELSEVGEKFNEVQKVVKIMVVIPEKYHTIIPTIEATKEADLTLDRAKLLLLELEHQLTVGNSKRKNTSASIQNVHAKKSRTSYQIFYRWQGTKVLVVESCDTIENVKIMISDKEGFPGHLPRLTFQGRELEDKRTVSDYNITSEATLHVLGRLLSCKGKCPVPSTTTSGE